MKKFLIFAAVFLTIFMVVVPLLSRPYLTRFALQKAQEALGTRIELDSASLQILQGSVVLRGLRIFHPYRKDEKIAEVRRLGVRIEYFPMLQGKTGLVSLELTRPWIVYQINKDGEWDLQRWVDSLTKDTKPKKEKEAKPPLPIVVERIVISNGQVDYRDGHVSSPPTPISISDIDFKITALQLPTPVHPLPSQFKGSFVVNVAAQANFAGRGDFLSPKMSFDGTASLTGLSLLPLAPYYESGLPMKITQGVLSFSTEASCKNNDLQAPLHLEIHDLQTEPKKMGFLKDTEKEIGIPPVGTVNLGDLKLDVMVTGDIQDPHFHLASDISKIFVKKLSEQLIQFAPRAVEGIGDEAGKRVKEGLDKFKGLFK
jgi:hypothetical protein